jgi:HPr kinase/phosphorylase
MMVSVHGALLEVYGIGAALLGPSGIGKSECALELLGRGHRLVADDVIELTAESGDRLMGRAPERVRHYMEIRGIGIFFVPDLYGENSVCDELTVDLVCRLERWREGAAYERVGLERPEEEIAGVRLPRLTLPTRSGGSMASIVELAAREHLQRRSGVNAAQRLDQRLRGEMERR